MISHKSKEKLQGFLQESEDLRLGAPVQGTVHEYEQHSGGILDTLMDMKEKPRGSSATSARQRWRPSSCTRW